jgi:predicted rRNA methylase YqxC with S4 and FtsJ domains
MNNFSDDLMMQAQSILEQEIKHSSYNYGFVIMSFKNEYDEIYDAIQLSRKALMSKVKQLKIERVDERKGAYVINDEIDECINKASFIICDISEKSPNVFYELGFSRAKNKKLILIAKEGTEPPFDVSHHRIIWYKNGIDLQNQLVEELSFHYRIGNKNGTKI